MFAALALDSLIDHASNSSKRTRQFDWTQIFKAVARKRSSLTWTWLSTMYTPMHQTLSVQNLDHSKSLSAGSLTPCMYQLWTKWLRVRGRTQLRDLSLCWCMLFVLCKYRMLFVLCMYRMLFVLCKYRMLFVLCNYRMLFCIIKGKVGPECTVGFTASSC